MTLELLSSILIGWYVFTIPTRATKRAELKLQVSEILVRFDKVSK